MTGINHTPYSFANDANLGEITDDSLVFLSTYSGEKNLQKLREHVNGVLTEVRSKHHVYRCIQALRFLKPRIDDYPWYKSDVLEPLTKQQQFTRILELGCCFGTDVRQLLLDGVSASKIVVSDLHSGYWEIGRKLFHDDDRVAGLQTIWGDFAAVAGTCVETPNSTEPQPVDVTALEAGFTHVVASAVLHVFSKQQCEIFIRNAHRVLSSGGMFFGSCAGQEVEGDWKMDKNQEGTHRYLHSRKSLEALLEKVGFVSATVERKPQNRFDSPSSADSHIQIFRFQGFKP